MTTRNEALGEIRSLIETHHISQAEILKLFTPSAYEESTSGGLLQRVMIYIGGAFIFMGLCVYIGMIWDDLDPLSRVIISLGSGFVSFILGLFCLGDPRYSKAATPLFLIAAGLQPLGLFVFMDEYLPHTGDVVKAASFVFAFMTIQQVVAFVATQRTSLLFFSLFYFYSFLCTLLNLCEIDAPEGPMVLGLTALMVSWGVSQTEHKSFAPFYFFWASAITAAASFDFLKYTSLDVLLVGVSAGLIYLSVVAASRTILTVGVISLLAFLGYFTDEYFTNIVSWPITLLVMGFIMIGVSVFAVKLGKKIAKHDV
jgi:hypothetical protein